MGRDQVNLDIEIFLLFIGNIRKILKIYCNFEIKVL